MIRPQQMRHGSRVESENDDVENQGKYPRGTPSRYGLPPLLGIARVNGSRDHGPTSEPCYCDRGTMNQQLKYCAKCLREDDMPLPLKVKRDVNIEFVPRNKGAPRPHSIKSGEPLQF